MPKWCVAQFVEDERIVDMTVPSHWVDRQNKQLLWPLFNVMDTYREARPPTSDWSTRVLIKVKYENDLKSKCDLYDETSAQEDSDSEHQPKQDQKRQRKSNPKYASTSFVSDFRSDAEEASSIATAIAKVKPPRKGKNSHTKQKESEPLTPSLASPGQSAVPYPPTPASPTPIFLAMSPVPSAQSPVPSTASPVPSAQSPVPSASTSVTTPASSLATNSAVTASYLSAPSRASSIPTSTSARSAMPAPRSALFASSRPSTSSAVSHAMSADADVAAMLEHPDTEVSNETLQKNIFKLGKQLLKLTDMVALLTAEKNVQNGSGIIPFFQFAEEVVEFNPSEKERKELVLRLLSIGGATLQKGVANTLAKVMSAPCMTMLNMLGGGPKGKKAFATTRLYGVVLDTLVQYHKVSEAEVYAKVQSHLKNAEGTLKKAEARKSLN